MDKLVNEAGCIPWDSWTNESNDLMWKIHLYIFIAMLFREIAEAYSISIFSVRVFMLLTIPTYLGQVVLCGFSLRAVDKRHEGWKNRWKLANGDKENPCYVDFGNAGEWLWAEILVLYINVIYLILSLMMFRFKSADNKIRTVMKTFKDKLRTSKGNKEE